MCHKKIGPFELMIKTQLHMFLNTFINLNGTYIISFKCICDNFCANCNLNMVIINVFIAFYYLIIFKDLFLLWDENTLHILILVKSKGWAFQR